MFVQWWHKACGSKRPISDLTWGLLIPETALMTMSLSMDSPETQGKIKYYCSKTKGLSKSYIKTYYCRSFFKYVIWKEFKMTSPYNGKHMPQLDTLWHKVKPPVLEMDYSLLNHWLKGSHNCPHKYHRILPKLLVTLCNLMVMPYCWRQHLFMSSSREKSSWCPTRSFTPTE